MKRHFLIALILFASVMYTISYASDDSDSQDKVFNLEQVDKPPRLVKFVPPIYPSIMTIDGLIYSEGRVTLRFIVTKDGGARDPEVVSAVPEGIFEESALESVKKYRFTPAYKDGQPVECIVKAPIRFSIPGVESSLDAYEATAKGMKYVKVGEYDNAVKAFTEAINISKKYSPGYAGRGIVYMELKEYEKAIGDFDNAIRRSPKIGLYYKLRGEAYNALKDYKKAVKDFNLAVKKEPEMLEAYFARGDAFRNLDKYSEAIADFTRVIELDQSYLRAYNNRAVVYNKLQDQEKMCLDLNKACELNDCRGLELAKSAGKCSDASKD